MRIAAAPAKLLAFIHRCRAARPKRSIAPTDIMATATETLRLDFLAKQNGWTVTNKNRRSELMFQKQL
jgi:hypothetical protein